MPSYNYLFQDARGEALIDYLFSLKAEKPREIWKWTVNTNCQPKGNFEQLFHEHCATCHDVAGQNAKYSRVFKRAPPNLASGPFIYTPPNLPLEVRRMQTARIIKFGIPGTDMPGHEYFSDETVFALTLFIEQLSNHK